MSRHPSVRRARRSPRPADVFAAVESVESRTLLSTVAPAYAAQIGLAGVISNATTFEDNFDGASLDKTKWQVRDGYRWRAYRDGPVSSISYTDASSVIVANGELSLVAHNDPVTGQLKGAYLQSGSTFNDSTLNSPVAPAKLTPGYSGSFQQTYGYWETRAKFSALPGEWASFWVHSYGMVGIRDDASKINQPAVYGTEMDVVEHSATRNGANSINAVSSIVNYNGYGAYGKAVGAYPDTTTLGPTKTAPSAYHVYGLLWTSTAVKFYVEGNLVNQVTDPREISKVPQMAMLSMEVGAPGSLEPGKGSNFFGSVPAGGYGSVAASKARATFDYVRVWSLASAPTTTTPTPTPTPPVVAAKTGTVTGTAFVDANANGRRDGSEATLAGLRVFADYDNDGKYDSGEPTTTTASNGTYTLGGLRVGTSTPILSAPASGQTQTLPAARTATIVGKYWVTLSAGQTVNAIDFGVKGGTVTTPVPTPTPSPTPSPTSSTVSGTVFLDANGNGKRDAGEVVRAGVRVFADYDNDDVFDANEPVATTAANGTYTIGGVRVGVNTGIGVVPLAGQTQTSPAGRSVTAPGRYWVTPTSGQKVVGIDFGVKLATTTSPTPTPTPTPTPKPTPTPTPPAVTTATVSGYVFVDANGNGKRDAGEILRSGVRVFADYDGDNVYDSTEPVATTAANGTYTLAGLRVGKGTSILTVAVAGQTQTSPAKGGALVGKYTYTFAAGQTVTNLVFGVKYGSGTTVSSPAVATVDEQQRSASTLWLDLDGDGRNDLV